MTQELLSQSSKITFRITRESSQVFSFADEIAEKGLEAIPELMRVLINHAMQAERSKYLQAEQYERTEDRKGHSNGFKPKTVKTRMGEITFAVPQVREGGFYPTALEKGLRSERALTITLAEMYVQGVSTRKVKAITEQLCGVEVSSTQVSRAAAQLDEVLQEWRERPWEKSAISTWMPDTRKSVKRGRYAMQPFWWLQGSLRREKDRF